jgi:lipopolysaccharide export system protein LptA
VKKVLFLIFGFLTALHSFSQQTSPINVVSSQSVSGDAAGLTHIIKPVFEHEGSTLAADSANLNTGQNTFNAFGNVLITQPDGTTIRSELLNYNGNTRIATLTRNVRMLEKGGALLSTNFLTYNMNTKIGTYSDGGRIINKQDTLTSKSGYYFENTKDAYFRYNVVVNTGDATVKADTMRYNTGTKIADFFGPTHIYSAEDTLYTELGDYNTTTRQAHGLKNNLYQQGSRTLKSDTIFYDDIKGTGKVNGNIVFNDTQEKLTMKGDIGVYARADSSTLITKNAYLIMLTQDSSETDSLWLTADTLQTKVILKSDFKPVRTPRLMKDAEVKDQISIMPVDSVSIIDTAKVIVNAKNKSSAPPDTSRTRVIFAYHHVKIFKSDLQAITDSVSYSYADSIIRCYSNPMVWSQGSQLSADTIYMQLKNRKLDNMILQHNGLIVSTEGDSSKYDQIKGRTMTGIFKNNKLSQLFIDGNAENIKYVKEDTSYTAINRSITSRIRMSFADGKLAGVSWIGRTEGRVIPIAKMKEEDKILQGFVWKPKDRPKSPEEIIPSLKNRPVAVIPMTPEKPSAAPVTNPKK